MLERVSQRYTRDLNSHDCETCLPTVPGGWHPQASVRVRAAGVTVTVTVTMTVTVCPFIRVCAGDSDLKLISQVAGSPYLECKSIYVQATASDNFATRVASGSPHWPAFKLAQPAPCALTITKMLPSLWHPKSLT